MIEFRTLPRDELPAWYTHCGGVFVADGPDYFRRHFEMDPNADENLIFVAMEDGAILSTVRVFVREIWLDGRTVAMGGIGEVSTNAAYRRRGLAGRLLEMAISAMNEREMPVSILGGDQGIYKRSGWRFCPGQMTETVVSALPPLSERLDIRPFAPGDLDAAMGMYDLFAGRLNGAIVRSPAYWVQWVLPQWREPMVLLYEGDAVAYGCAAPSRSDPATLHVSEMCAAPQGEAFLGAFLRALAARRGASAVRFLTRLAPQVEGRRETIDNIMMVRLNRPLWNLDDSDALALKMAGAAGMFGVDSF